MSKICYVVLLKLLCIFFKNELRSYNHQYILCLDRNDRDNKFVKHLDYRYGEST